MKREPAKVPGAFLRLMEFEQLQNILRLEIREREEEGFDVARLREMLEDSGTKTHLVSIYNKLLNAPRAREFKFFEPDTLSGIRAARPDGPREARPGLDPEALSDRIHGGWLGRVAGCVLGKPVEPWGRKETIVEYLKLAGSYPLTNYIPRLDPFPVEYYPNPSAAGTFLGEIHGAPQDDDTDYTVLGLHLVETYGLALKTSDVASEWLDHLAYTRTWTAERTAYRNLVLGIPPEQAASLLNPEREYIGARIRADIYGLVCPGKPELAATLVYQDAALSHTKNGIYSAMLMASMIAWSFMTTDIEEIVRVGLSEIPGNCRLAEGILDVLARRSGTDDWESVYERLLPEQAACHPVHAINNTIWMVLALLHGNGNFEKTICTAVLCGFDTDCNGANAGTVLGTLSGARGLPCKWIDPLEDTLHTAVAGCCEMRISELARRTARLAENNLLKE